MIVSTLMKVTVASDQVLLKQILRINKTLADVLNATSEAFEGFKLHREVSWTGDHFLAVRCEAASASCAKLPFE